jgi:site-specific DNA recombinase
MRAAIYVRVSTEDQVAHGYSLPEQREACRKRATELGAEKILEFADEGISGAILERPGLNALREAISAGQVDVLIIRDPDRFSRKLSHQLLLVEEFEKAGVRLEFLDFEWKDTPEGRLFYAVKGAFAEYEREKICRQTKRGRIKKAKMGGVPCGFDRYGYRYDPQTGQISVVDEEAEVVRKIFGWFTTEDIGVIGLANRLTDLGVPTRRNASAWSRTVVWHILKSPAYKGEWVLRFGPEEVTVPVPAIVDAETWQRAQEKLQRSRRQWGGGEGKRAYLLRGILSCGDCGCPMRGKSGHTNGGRYWYAWYTCHQPRALSRNTGCRPQKVIPAEVLESVVWERVKAAISDPDAVAREAAAMSPESNSLRAELERVERRLAETEKGREAILDALAAGLFDLDAKTKAKLMELKRRKERLERRKKEMEAAMRSAESAETKLDELRALAENVVGRLDELIFEEKRELVRALVSQVVVTGRKRSHAPGLAGVAVTVVLNLGVAEQETAIFMPKILPVG